MMADNRFLATLVEFEKDSITDKQVGESCEVQSKSTSSRVKAAETSVH